MNRNDDAARIEALRILEGLRIQLEQRNAELLAKDQPIGSLTEREYCDCCDAGVGAMVLRHAEQHIIDGFEYR